MRLFDNTQDLSRAMAYTASNGDKIYPIIVDIKRGIQGSEEISFVSSDIRTGVISVALVNNSVPYNVYGRRALCTILRPDASMFEVECECIQNNIIEIELGTLGTRLDGIYSFDIKIQISETKTVGTPQMSYSVTQSLDMDEVILEDDRVPVLTTLITQTEEAVATAGQALNRVVALESEMQDMIQEGKETIDEVGVSLSNVNTALGEVGGAVVRLDNAISKGEQDIAAAIASIPSKEELKGDQGIQGIQGIQGEKGEKGDTGEQGIQGLQGEKGDKGDTGAKGEKGDKGDKGEQGIQGEQGLQGIQGIQGVKGDKGDKGEDGLTVGVSVNGETYQHQNGIITIPNYPDTSNLEALNKTPNISYRTEGGIKSFECTRDGYIDNVVIEGKTLVNLWGNKTSDFFLSGQAIFNEETGYVELTSTTQRYSNAFTKYTGNLKPNTLYTIIVDVVENTFTNIPILRVSSTDSVEAGNDKYACFTDTKVINGGETGRFIFQLTTISDFNNVNIGLRTFIGNDNSEVGCKLKFRIIILEGDHTQNPPSYFEGLKSVGEDVNKISVSSLKSSGNLLHCEDFSVARNGVTLTYNFVNQEFTLNGTCTQNNTTLFYPSTIDKRSLFGYYSGRLILLNPNMANFNVRFYEKSYTRGVVLNNNKLTHTGNYNNGDIVTFTIRVDNGQTFNNDKFKICFNKGNTPIPYEPYKEHKKELLYKDTDGVWKKPILREWDTIEKHSGSKYYYHKRSGEVVLNGSENIKLYKSQKAQCITFEVSTKGIKLTGDQAVISDKFTYQYSGFNDKYDFESISNSGKYSNIYISILKSRLETQNVEGFKKWLQSNPITVVYELETPIITELPNFNPQTFEGDTTLLINSGAIQANADFEVTNSLGSEIDVLKDKVSSLDDNISDRPITKYELIPLNGWSKFYGSSYITRSGDVFSINIGIQNGIVTAGTILFCINNPSFIPKVNQVIFGNDDVTGNIIYEIAIRTNGTITIGAKSTFTSKMFISGSYNAE